MYVFIATKVSLIYSQKSVILSYPEPLKSKLHLDNESGYDFFFSFNSDYQQRSVTLPLLCKAAKSRVMRKISFAGRISLIGVWYMKTFKTLFAYRLVRGSRRIHLQSGPRWRQHIPHPCCVLKLGILKIISHKFFLL